MLWRDRLAGLIDAKIDREEAVPTLRVTGLDLAAPVPMEILRAGLHRFARLTGAEKLAIDTRATRDLRRALVGKLES
jgi:uncharacterized protein YcaQ